MRCRNEAHPLKPADLYLAVFLVLSLTFRVGRLAVVIRRARQRGRGRTTAPAVFWIMTVGYLFFLGCCVAAAREHAQQFNWPVSLTGLMIYGGSLGLRERAMLDIGRYFSPDIEIHPEHRVVRAGLYRVIRHPLLVCMALEILGLGLLFNAYAVLLVLGLGIYFPLIVLRQRLEEKALVKALGEGYRSYQRDVGAFWPRWQVLFPSKKDVMHA